MSLQSLLTQVVGGKHSPRCFRFEQRCGILPRTSAACFVSASPPSPRAWPLREPFPDLERRRWRRHTRAPSLRGDQQPSTSAFGAKQSALTPRCQSVERPVWCPSATGKRSPYRRKHPLATVRGPDNFDQRRILRRTPLFARLLSPWDCSKEKSRS